MSSPQLAILAPRDGVIGKFDAKTSHVIVHAPRGLAGTCLDARLFVSRYADSTVVPWTTEADLRKELDSERSKAFALDFTLLLLQGSLSEDVLSQCACELNDLLQDDAVHQSVLGLISARPLRLSVDDQDWKSHAKEFHRVESLLLSICSSQTRAKALHETMLPFRDSKTFQEIGFDRLTGELIERGFFRKLVVECTSRDDVAKHSMTIVMDCSTGNAALQHELIAIINTYKNKLRGSHLSSEQEAATWSAAKAVSDGRRTAQLSDDGNVLAQVESTIARIVDLYREDKNSTGDKFRQELIEAQTQGSTSQEYVVKSLCNIAAKCRTVGRSDKGSECLELALGYSDGIDSVLYLQIAGQLRDTKQFDRAVTCLDKAAQLDDGSRIDSIQLERSRILTDTGEYDAAIEAFHLINSLQDDPSALCSLGTLYRRIGKLREARAEYRCAIKTDRHCHGAQAGMAEASRQSGRYARALEIYDCILPVLSDEDENARKVYDLSRSKLLRYLRRFTQARHILESAFDRFPMDSRVNLELSKFWRIQGDIRKANEFLNKSTVVPANQAAAKLYLVAIGESVELSEQVDLGAGNREAVEDQSLNAVSGALQALNDGDYPRAIRHLDERLPVDRIGSDFAEVLHYHASTALAKEMVSLRNQRINRIAKRGFPELKHAVSAIDERDFSGALDAEKQLAILL